MKLNKTMKKHNCKLVQNLKMKTFIADKLKSSTIFVLFQQIEQWNAQKTVSYVPMANVLTVRECVTNRMTVQIGQMKKLAVNMSVSNFNFWGECIPEAGP